MHTDFFTVVQDRIMESALLFPLVHWTFKAPKDEVTRMGYTVSKGYVPGLLSSEPCILSWAHMQAQGIGFSLPHSLGQ